MLHQLLLGIVTGLVFVVYVALSAVVRARRETVGSSDRVGSGESAGSAS